MFAMVFHTGRLEPYLRDRLAGRTMARTAQTKGRCGYCGREMTCTGIGRHLRSCADRLRAGEEAARRRGSRENLYHLQVRDDYGLGYWLHLEMDGTATLFDLDEYLRGIWLECCGHLSSFEINGLEYMDSGDDSFGFRESGSVDATADQVLSPGLTFAHEYDFGTTTELSIRVLDTRTGRPTTRFPIALMARNNPLDIPCAECDQPAQLICLDCCYRGAPGDGHVCTDHAQAHAAHDDYGKMPIFNSPRSGVCGYSGPAAPPY